MKLFSVSVLSKMFSTFIENKEIISPILISILVTLQDSLTNNNSFPQGIAKCNFVQSLPKKTVIKYLRQLSERILFVSAVKSFPVLIENYTKLTVQMYLWPKAITLDETSFTKSN